jgi:hypothetical protein
MEMGTAIAKRRNIPANGSPRNNLPLLETRGNTTHCFGDKILSIFP